MNYLSRKEVLYFNAKKEFNRNINSLFVYWSVYSNCYVVRYTNTLKLYKRCNFVIYDLDYIYLDHKRYNFLSFKIYQKIKTTSNLY